MREILDDTSIDWKSVYAIPENEIVVDHTFPASEYVKTSVILPISAS